MKRNMGNLHPICENINLKDRLYFADIKLYSIGLIAQFTKIIVLANKKYLKKQFFRQNKEEVKLCFIYAAAGILLP